VTSSKRIAPSGRPRRAAWVHTVTSPPSSAASVGYVGHATVLVDLGGVRLLTDPLLRSRVAHLRRLKENGIMGQLIPAGTGMPYYQRVEIPEEVYEAREETFDQDYKPDFAAGEEVVTGGTYGADS